MCWLKKLLYQIFTPKPDPEEIRQDKVSRQDNKDPNDDRTAPGKIELWYPDRKTGHAFEKARMRTRGRYRQGYPEGATVHFTAGRSRPSTLGGKRNAKTAEGQAQRAINYAVDQNSYCYFLIDHDGNVYQQFPLNEWGYHAGSSSWKGISGSVSDELVGIEIMCAGKLSEAGNGKYKAWFTRTDKGDSLFGDDEVRHLPKERHNMKRGVYHKYTDAQEKALRKLLMWLEKNGQGIFKFNFVLGHDEVAPGRKNDPGASLSMSMPEFRQVLKRRKSNA